MTKKIFLFIILSLICFNLPAKSKKAEPKVIKVACVGNSITYGYAIKDREKDSYPAKLQQMLGSGYEVGNFGRNGATLLFKGHRPYVTQEEYAAAKAFAGDIVVIHLGINDTDPRNWPNFRDEFIGDYYNLIDSFRQVNPKCKILIARLTPILPTHERFISSTRDFRDEISEAIEKVATNADVQLIDFFEPLYSHPDMFADALHPNEKGAAVLADVVYKAITGNYGGLQMPLTYSDNMVLQYGQDITIAGTADAKEVVTVEVQDQKQSAAAGTDGKWSVKLSPLSAGGPFTLKVSTKKKTILYNNVLAGDVWLCSGQSNMGFALAEADGAKEEIANAKNPYIRLYNMSEGWRTDMGEWSPSAKDSVNDLHYLKKDGWELCDSTSAPRFSAIGYFFGKELQDSLQIPIGLIGNAVGGSPIESWIDRGSLEREFPTIFLNWPKNDYPGDWVRQMALVNSKPNSGQIQRHPYEPCYLYEDGILSLQHYDIKGVIWYQGEGNAHNVKVHHDMFKLLIDGWRNYWHNPALPFYYVQISSLSVPTFHLFRDSQRQLLKEFDHVGMAVSSDVGHPTMVHPTNKKPVGHRLALWALNQTYGKSYLTPSGPLFESARFEDGKSIVTFEYGKGLHASDNKQIKTFELAGPNGIYYPAEATPDGDNTLVVTSEQVPSPSAIRYGWQPYTEANLVNSDNLPASTFRFEKE